MLSQYGTIWTRSGLLVTGRSQSQPETLAKALDSRSVPRDSFRSDAQRYPPTSTSPNRAKLCPIHNGMGCVTDSYR